LKKDNVNKLSSLILIIGFQTEATDWALRNLPEGARSQREDNPWPLIKAKRWEGLSREDARK
jgi:hypothetical protein